MGRLMLTSFPPFTGVVLAAKAMVWKVKKRITVKERISFLFNGNLHLFPLDENRVAVLDQLPEKNPCTLQNILSNRIPSPFNQYGDLVCLPGFIIPIIHLIHQHPFSPSLYFFKVLSFGKKGKNFSKMRVNHLDLNQ